MSVYPLMLHAESLEALVVGGGTVAARKTRSLLAAGATVRLVAPSIDPALDALAVPALSLVRRAYAPTDIGDAGLVIAATSSREVNARVARDALARRRLVTVVDAPEEGNCTSPATHRAGDVVIAVSAGGVPSVAARIRDCLARRYAEPYAQAVAELSMIRSRLLSVGDRSTWHLIVDSIVDEDFCETVERGELAARVASWR